MGIKLFLDDMRTCPDGYVLARNYDECILMLTACEVEVLSLDHDLGAARTGYDVAKWIVEKNRWPKQICFHTSNPVGRRNMQQLLQRYAPPYVAIDR
ncbi:cyclic-phosphate processing receiver domain-containing protein [Alicyclobacillus cycloheptanicus]|uniref:Cyclic-phosphate processing Receiver domain-containing protein n=1 Tax=Alicyclobacillus cycloheptanicus TaxID=1457 RepID=A0ABT9XJX4_9BACL|nr:hypothetical protein [Alicyclobacillus cycloheptanicus]